MPVAGPSELVFPFGILGKPAFLDALFLFEHFLDGPEGGEGEDAEQRGYQNVVHADGGNDACHAQQEEYPPAACAPIILGLDHDGVEEADDQKGADADEQA